MSAGGKLAFALAHRLRGSSSLRLYREIRHEPSASPEVVQSLQLQRLRDLLSHAGRTVPYYAELFRSIGLEPADVRTHADFARIPVLTKDILRERRDDLVSNAFDQSRLLIHNSGGSTGVPISFFRDRSYLDASDAGTYRNLAQCGWKPGDMVAFVWGSNARIDAMSRVEFELRQRLRRFYQLDPFQSSQADLDRWVERMRRIRPTAVLGYASTIGRLARRMLDTGQTLDGVRGVFTTAERLYAPQRADMQHAFRCGVYDLYGSSEVQNIAAECPNGRMHVNADFCHLEFEGALQLQESRPLLVTSLKSMAFPFIRYRNDDSGAGEELTPCACGSGFPVMRLTVARESDNFTLPSGRVVHGEFFTHLMYGTTGVERFQFHQVEADRIVLRIVPAPGDERAATQSGSTAAQNCRASLGRRSGWRSRWCRTSNCPRRASTVSRAATCARATLARATCVPPRRSLSPGKGKMCGICGVVRRRAIGEEEHLAVGRMVRLMRHRGPDGLACWGNGSAMLGHARLAIIDIDGGRQPMVSADEQIALVFNGEIYNYRELKAELVALGATFSTKSDTEVVLVGYRLWGDEVFERLNGMFALGIWDAARSELVLARDRYGEKPLYVHERGDGRIAFASEMKALFADPSIERRFNDAVFAEYLAFRAVGAGETLFEGVEEFPAATVRRYSEPGRVDHRFWSPAVAVREGALDTALHDVEQLLYAATERRLVSDVPVGSIVSGGLDSSLVTAMAIRAAGQPLDTFCVGFDDPALDERPYARAMAEHVGARHHELVVRDHDFAASLLPLTWAHDAPLTHPNAVPMHLVFQFARETAGVKVVLSGEGADELFGGYAWYSTVSKRPPFLSASTLDVLARLLPSVGPLATARRVFRADYPLEANAVTGLHRLEQLGLSTASVRASRRRAFDRSRSERDALYLFDQRTYLAPLLQRQDRMAMAAGVEARVVFLDHLLAESVNALPDAIKRPGGVRKGLLRRVAREWLPEAQLVRPKVGFTLPLARWLSRGGALFEFRDYLRGGHTVAATMMEEGLVRRLVDQDVLDDPAAADLLWSLISLEIWASIFLGPTPKEFTVSGATRSVTHDQHGSDRGAVSGPLHLS